MPIRNRTKESKAAAVSNDDRLASLAGQSLHHFEETAATARLELGEPRPSASNTFANLNSLTNERALRNFEQLTQSQINELRQLCNEPAIARIVAQDETGAIKVYYISRATPHRSPSDGSAAVSYRAPAGRLASLPVGSDLEITLKNGSRTLTVLERALLRPTEKGGEWDSLNSVVQGEAFGPFTISSFRQLLLKSGTEADAIDDLEAALSEDRAEAVVVEGLRRDALTKMELRDLAVLDEFQDSIFRLPLDTHLVLLGPPGTGKTTTLIKRLGLKLDEQHLSDDERDMVATTVAGAARHTESWIMFTPTTLLKQYIKEAFARENIPASDDRIQTWDDFRRDIARNRFNILRSASGGGQLVSKEGLPSLQAATLNEQVEWYQDFEAWHLDAFWNDLRGHADLLAADKTPEIARLGKQLVEALPSSAPALHASVFPELVTLSESIQAAILSLKETTDKAIREAIAKEHRNDREFLDQLVTLVATLSDGDDADDDVEDEEEVRQIRVGRDAAVDALSRALRAKARSIASGRTLSKQSRSGRLVDWFGERGPSREVLRALGGNLQLQAAARRFVNPVRRLISGLTSRYRRFRRERQADGRWYNAEGFAFTDLNPLEVDIILLATFKAGRGLLSDRRIARDIDQGSYSSLISVRSLYRTQVLVDEATDFSPIQLACMSCLCDPASSSFVACGDFNQRITEWGSRSDDDMKWVFSDLDVRSVSITYRHSRQLNELARSIALLSSPDVPEAQLPQRVNNDGFEPVLAVGLKDRRVLAEWLSQRITEIERLTQTLPPVAVLVADETEVQPVAKALDEILAGGNIRAVPCPFGQLAGQDNDVRVFDVRHIKGLEFEAVFFTSIDRLAELQPDLFEKYLYVGATRAAMYLGLTTEGAFLPSKVASLRSRFQTKWP